MSPSLAIAILWLAFGASHIGLSSMGLRPRLVGALGEKGFMGLYSLVALATFVPLVSVYFGHVHEGAELWSFDLSTPAQWVLYVVMGVAFVLVAASLVTPSPSGLSTGRAPVSGEPRGVHFITRHALFMGIGLFGLAHLVPNGYATDVAFFGGFPIFVVCGAWHQDRRKLATGPEGYRDFCAATPLIPFTGGQTLRGLRELSPVAVAIGVGLVVVLRLFHETLFG